MKKFREVQQEMLDLLPHDNRAASGPDVIKRNTPIRAKTIAKNVQKPWIHNKIQALAGKQPEFNRGKGSQRNPFTPKQTITGPNEVPSVTKSIPRGLRKESANPDADDFDPKDSNREYAEKEKQMVYDQQANPEKYMKKTFKDIREGRSSEYNANVQLSSTKGSRKPGHYLTRHGVPLHNQPHATSQAALSAYHNLADKSNVKIQHVKEEAPAMSAGAAGDPGHVQNATDNYASQRKNWRMFRRKNPIVGSNNIQGIVLDNPIGESLVGNLPAQDRLKKAALDYHKSRKEHPHFHINQTTGANAYNLTNKNSGKRYHATIDGSYVHIGEYK